MLKKIDLNAVNTVSVLEANYTQEIISLNIVNIAQEITNKINIAAAAHLKRCRLQDFENWLVSVLRSEKNPKLIEKIRELLPIVDAR